MEKLIDRILEISYKRKLSHIGSCLSTLPILVEIYKEKKEEDAVVLSNGHAGLAQYVILEDLYGFDPEDMLDDFGVHPARDLERKIEVTSGSLGCGIGISVGMALANKNRHVYCVISDGECAEGLVWESLAFVYANKLNNLKVYVNINGHGAYCDIDKNYLINRLKSFLPTINIRETDSSFLNVSGIDSHYKTLSEEDYRNVTGTK